MDIIVSHGGVTHKASEAPGCEVCCKVLEEWDKVKPLIEGARNHAIDEALKILTEEIATSHTSLAGGKTSRLTAAYNRILALKI